MSLQALRNAGKIERGVLEKLIGPMVGRQVLANAAGYVENAGAPTSLAPDFIGQLCFDTTNSDFYLAFGTSAGTWAALGLDNLSLTELQYLDTVVAGTVTASKVVVVDANKDVGTFRNLRTTRVISSEGAPTSDATAGARTYTAAEILGGLIVRDCAGAGRSDVLPTAALLVAAVPNATVGDIIRCIIVNGSDAAETITIGAGTGGGFDTNQTAASRVIPQNTSKTVYIRL